MTIPEAAYLTGNWEVSEKEKYEALDAARTYHANRSVCLARQKHLPIYRLCFLIMLMPLFGYFLTEFWQEDLNHYMAIISVIYTPVAVCLAGIRKNLLIPAIGAWVYSAEFIRLDDPTAIVPTLIPVIILNLLAYLYEKNRRWLHVQPGYPDFHDITVRVKEEQLLTKREVPPSGEPCDDPYKDVLSSLQ